MNSGRASRARGERSPRRGAASAETSLRGRPAIPIGGDTIAAVSSPPGCGERAVLRVSGRGALMIARGLAPLPRRRGVHSIPLRIGGLRLSADVWIMPAPGSYTGEDVVEFHVPGSPPIVRRLMDRLSAAGARPAGPGEFTRRAFLNGRLDLIQAESVLEVIRAGSEEELRAAEALLQGAFSKRLRDVEDRLLSLVADLEAAIDFVDQDIELMPRETALRRVAELGEALRDLAAESRAAGTGTDEPAAFLVGAPNAGKSTLFNALVGARAIASDVAGTTRDLLEGRLGPLRIYDSPGLSPAGPGTESRVATSTPLTDLDLAAARRAEDAARNADLWLVVVDASDPGSIGSRTGARPALAVVTKVDLVGEEAALRLARRLPIPEAFVVSGKTGAGIGRLRARLEAWAGELSGGPQARFTLSRRQWAMVRQAARALDRAADVLRADLGWELAALDARAAMEALGMVTGRQVDEAILDRIFERFCIGK